MSTNQYPKKTTPLFYPNYETTVHVPGSGNPYLSNPYGSNLPPPPPPHQGHKGLIIILVGVICLLVVMLASVLFVIYPTVPVAIAPHMISTRALQIPTPILKPPMQPAPTAPLPQPTTAYSLYQNIVNNLDSHHKVTMKGYDTKWSGWPYTPERNAILFTDTTPDGTFTVEIAVFNSPTEAQADYQCQFANKCSKLSYQGNDLQGTYNGACLFMDNNYNGNGSQYSDYMLDDLQAFNNTAC